MVVSDCLFGLGVLAPNLTQCFRLMLAVSHLGVRSGGMKLSEFNCWYNFKVAQSRQFSAPPWKLSDFFPLQNTAQTVQKPTRCCKSFSTVFFFFVFSQLYSLGWTAEAVSGRTVPSGDFGVLFKWATCVNCIGLRRKLFTPQIEGPGSSTFICCTHFGNTSVSKDWPQLFSVKGLVLFRCMWCAQSWTGLGYLTVAGHIWIYLTFLLRLGSYKVHAGVPEELLGRQCSWVDDQWVC